MDTKKTAQAIKDFLVKLAVDDKLPLDMNKLPLNGIEKILKKAIKAAEPTQFEKAVIEAGHYLSGDDMEEQVNLILKQADIDDSVIIDSIEGVLVWEKVEYQFTVEKFLQLIGL